MGMSESSLLRAILIRASALGMRLFRNQVGKYQLPDGRWITSGLCVGSSDLIGWTPVVITQAMVGRTIAVFTAIETKAAKKHPTKEQEQFLSVVASAGGLASVARTIEDVEAAQKGLYALPRAAHLGAQHHLGDVVVRRVVDVV